MVSNCCLVNSHHLYSCHVVCVFLTNLLKSALTKQRCGKVTHEDNIRDITFRNVVKKKDLGTKNWLNEAAWNTWNLAYMVGKNRKDHNVLWMRGLDETFWIGKKDSNGSAISIKYGNFLRCLLTLYIFFFTYIVNYNTWFTHLYCCTVHFVESL